MNVDISPKRPPISSWTVEAPFGSGSEGGGSSVPQRSRRKIIWNLLGGMGLGTPNRATQRLGRQTGSPRASSTITGGTPLAHGRRLNASGRRGSGSSASPRVPRGGEVGARPRARRRAHAGRGGPARGAGVRRLVRRGRGAGRWLAAPDNERSPRRSHGGAPDGASPPLPAGEGRLGRRHARDRQRRVRATERRTRLPPDRHRVAGGTPLRVALAALVHDRPDDGPRPHHRRAYLLIHARGPALQPGGPG